MLQWLTSGAVLSNPASPVALAFIVHYILMPLAQLVAIRLKRPITGLMAVTVVHYLAIGLAVTVGFMTHSALPLSGIVGLGAIAAQLAMGIHQTNALIAQASAKKSAEDTTLQPGAN